MMVFLHRCDRGCSAGLSEHGMVKDAPAEVLVAATQPLDSHDGVSLQM